MKLFVIVLTMIFITLKLMGHIAWAWVWVLSPLWILWLAIPLALIVLAILLAFIDTAFEKPKYRY